MVPSPPKRYDETENNFFTYDDEDGMKVGESAAAFFPADQISFDRSGSMVAIFRYSPINILSVRLPPSILEFNSKAEQAWTRREAAELLSKAKSFYGEIASAFNRIEEKSSSIGCELYDTSELQNYMLDLKDLLMKEQEDYNDLLQPTDEGISDKEWEAIDILEINR
nr:putative 1-phosphatidylinositol-3-phosphate 5-kinase FAB1C [Ipomoea batatas]